MSYQVTVLVIILFYRKYLFDVIIPIVPYTLILYIGAEKQVLYIPWILRINLSKPTNPKDELV